MGIEIAVILIFGFIIIYGLVIEIFSILFRITGLTREKARFQAISILTSCGFTTSESEIITTDKARRKIAAVAMIFGYFFSVIIVSLIINLLVNLKKEATDSAMDVILLSFLAFVVLIILYEMPFVKKPFEKVIEKIGFKVLKRNQYSNTVTMLDNYGNEAIAEVTINRMPKALENKTIFEARIRDTYKLNILMIKRKSKVIQITKDTLVQKQDTLVVFGNKQNIKDLFTNEVADIPILLEADLVEKENAIDLMDNYGTDAMAEIHINVIPKFMKHQTLYESKLKEIYQINILVLKRGDRPIKVTKDTIIEKYDSLIVFGPYDKIKEAFLTDKNNSFEED